MTTFWSQPKTCKAFEAYQDSPEQLLGYRCVFQALNPERADCRRILDYGCGSGRIAFQFVQMTHKQVLAVDNSQRMLAIAAGFYSHPLIQYELLRHSNLEQVADNSLDGAMACYVFINYALEAQILETLREIYRVLKPGTPFVILDTNPDTTGIEFSTFRNGKPGKHYGYGDPIEVTLHIPGQPDLVIPNYHWPRSMYCQALRAVGFETIVVYEYTLADLSSEERQQFEASSGFCDWKAEWQHPPCLVIKATK